MTRGKRQASSVADIVEGECDEGRWAVWVRGGSERQVEKVVMNNLVHVM